MGEDDLVSSPIRSLAELAVRVGVDVQRGQDVVVIGWDVEQAPIVRAVAEEAYARGARFVSAVYWDQHVKRSRLLRAPSDSLDFVPDWWDAIRAECVARRSAVIYVWGDPHRELLEDIAPERVARDLMPITPSLLEAAGRGDFASTVVPGPCPGVARAVLGTPDVDRLWELMTPMLRLDAVDPITAWREHIARLKTRAALMTQRNFSALRFRGGGTDLTVGLLSGARWLAAVDETRWGTQMVSNMPTEEVYSTPDHRRTEGVVRVSRPIYLTSGGRIEGLTLRFEHGRAIGIDAVRGADFVRAQMAVDDGADRLGEVALVDGSSPVGKSGVVFGDGLIDENATSHIAWGNAYAATVPELPEEQEAQVAIGFNRSNVHQDAMIGGPEVDVFGVDEDCGETPVIVGDKWVLD
jgi:aminopeptidase